MTLLTQILLPRSRCGVASILLLVTSLAAAGQHSFGDFAINVGTDGGEGTASSEYQITVENHELLLSRLTASHAGALSNSFVVDLDKDGAFEVIVTFSYPSGGATDVHIYSWKEDRLSPHKVAKLDDSQKTGYQGNDEIAVQNGQLIRIYQLYQQVDGEWIPTAEQRRLHYSLAESRWINE